MKRIFTLFVLFTMVSSVSYAQFIFSQTRAPQTVTSEPIGGEAVVWDAPAASKVAALDGTFQSTIPAFPAINTNSNWLFSTNFGFTVPGFATIDSVVVIIVRRRRPGGGAGTRDNRLQLVSGGSLVGVDNAATALNWPTAFTARNYPTSGSPTWGLPLTPAQVNDPSFGFGLVAMKLSGPVNASTIADVEQIQIRVVYNSLFPIVLTNFNVKAVDDKVAISFTTESETKVKTLFIERSSDGRNYTDLFAIQPKGAENIKSTYNLTDAAPLLGTNYYRLKEIDIDGKWHYYETRQVKISSISNKFQAYQKGSNVVINFNNQPGAYTATIVDMNGAVVAKQAFRVDKQSVQVSMTPPISRTGVYMVNLKGGNGFSESLKLFIQR